MKKILSSVVAIAMLSSTVAMAATVVAPTPQTTTKTTVTQSFDALETANLTNPDATGDSALYVTYGTGAEAVDQGGWSSAPEIVANPYSDDPETTTDKVLLMERIETRDEKLSFKMNPNATIEKGDIIKLSLDFALADKDDDKTNIALSMNINDNVNKTLFAMFSNNWQNANSYNGVVTSQPDLTMAVNEMKHYEVKINPGNRTITYSVGTSSNTYTMIDAMPDITTLNSFSFAIQHGDAASGKAYLNNLSYEIINVPVNVEEFDGVKPRNEAWGTNQTLNYAKYHVDGPNISNVNDLDEIDRGGVLKVSGNANNGNYVAMPLNYTMTGEDVFTFKFDYAFTQAKDSDLTFYLNDVAASGNGAKVNLTAVDGGYSYSITNGMLFKLVPPDGTATSVATWVNGNYENQSYDVVARQGEFNTITVVIDNSDEECANQRTFAIYINGELSRTKWIMTDPEGEDNSTITGVSIGFTGGWPMTTRYFDNMWATMTSNKIEVGDGVASYTYPVVHDESQAQFIVAKYNADGVLTSAEKKSVDPADGLTVTSPCTPDETGTTKVFLWSSILNPIVDTWDSSKAN